MVESCYSAAVVCAGLLLQGPTQTLNLHRFFRRWPLLNKEERKNRYTYGYSMKIFHHAEFGFENSILILAP